MHTEQFKIFQKKQDNSEFIDSLKKTQNFNPLPHFTTINKEKIIKLKWSKEYCDSLENKHILEDHYKLLVTRKRVMFKEEGYTKRTLIDTCILFDENLKNKTPHPKTKEQKEQHLLGLKKQKESNDAKNQSKHDKNDAKADEEII